MIYLLLINCSLASVVKTIDHDLHCYHFYARWFIVPQHINNKVKKKDGRSCISSMLLLERRKALLRFLDFHAIGWRGAGMGSIQSFSWVSQAPRPRNQTFHISDPPLRKLLVIGIQFNYLIISNAMDLHIICMQLVLS